MVKKYVFGVMFLVLITGLLGISFAEARDKEVGVVKYEKYDYGKGPEYKEWAYSNFTQPLFEKIKELGFSPEWVSVDIFLPENKEERDTYKRIVISSVAYMFTPEMYEGMKDYIQKGGLLITNSSLIHSDSNRNYKIDSGDETKDSGVIGVWGWANTKMTKIKIVQSSPLTEGIESNKWLNFEAKVSGRMTKYGSASVLVVSDVIYEKESPFLTYNKPQQSEGACIYIVSHLGSDALADKYLSRIFKNALSEKVYKWLVWVTNDEIA